LALKHLFKIEMWLESAVNFNSAWLSRSKNSIWSFTYCQI